MAIADETQASLQALLDDRSRLILENEALRNPPVVPLDLTVPTYQVFADPVKVGDKTAMVRVRRNKKSLYSLTMRWKIDTRVTAPVTAAAGLPANQTGEFCFDYDVDEILIPVNLATNGLTGTQGFYVVVYNPRIYGSLTFAESKALVQLNGPAIPALEVTNVQRLWNQPIKRRVPGGWVPTFFSNLVDNFEANDSGLRADGTPCFRSKLAHGRAQWTNAEVGFYTDPVLFPPTNPYQMVGAKRALVAEKLSETMVFSEEYGLLLQSDPRALESGNKKTVTHSSPIVSTEKMPLFGYGRFSYKFALPDATLGMWPAGWQLCLPHQRWPDCEQDTVEISFKGAANVTFPYMTNWWDAGGAKNQGQFANVFELLPGFNHADPHEYWMDWTPTVMRWGVDDTLVFSTPARFFLANPADPADPNRIYMMLQIAIGGNAGPATAGVYPAHMVVDHMAHYAMPS